MCQKPEHAQAIRSIIHTNKEYNVFSFHNEHLLFQFLLRNEYTPFQEILPPVEITHAEFDEDRFVLHFIFTTFSFRKPKQHTPY